jgi:DNA (cytosine-5)-methyltransferase 1
MTPLTVGSTFTGVGGADIGFEQAGFTVSWQCELDAWKRSILAAHWPGIVCYDDITTMIDPPAVDVLIGGFPCQDLSVAGQRKGFTGERSVLAFEFLRLAESIQPKWLILENVPGLLSSASGADFARLIDEVVACGYGVAWRILDARFFGVPQRRRRAFIVARRTGAGIDPAEASRLALRALRESGDGDIAPGWQAWQETARSATGSTGSSSRVGVNGDVRESISNAVTRKWSKGTRGPAGDECQNLITESAAFRKSRRAQTVDDDETWVEGDHSNTLNSFDAGDVRTTHAVVDHTSVRRLSPVECERLMGWPDEWTAPPGVKVSDSKRYAACGDGIVTPVAFWIADRIKMIEGEL